MCGIAGIVYAGAAPIEEDLLGTMTSRIAHRGPDGQGLFRAPGVGLGHRRLSILDLSDAASQPMAAGDTVVTYNGEIYNYRTLRDELIAAGESFTSTGDTEVLVKGLRRWGTATFGKIQGMFAIGAWDSGTRTLLLARDRFGKKPIYYAPFGPNGRDGLAFGSELRALLAHPRVRAEAEVDPVALGQYLTHEYVPAPRSILANVKKVLPSQYLSWKDGGEITLHEYYVPPFAARNGGDTRELTEELTRLVTLATADRLVADVPVGIFLSGGLDSSFIAACAVRAHPRVKTFSIGFEDASFDESSHARAVAQHLGTEHVEEKLSAATMLDLVPGTLDWIDEPFADSSMLPTSMLARVARRDVTVALGGDGGDEILAGYPTFVADRATSRLPALPAPFARVARKLAGHVPPSDGNFSLAFKLQQFAQGLDARGGLRHAHWLAPMLPDDIAAIAGPSLTESALTHAFDADATATAGLTEDFDAATAFYLRVYLGEGVLTKVDRATMRVSLEARAPLLDTRVVEFCLGLEPSLRLRGTSTKWLMRQALAPMVPRSIVERPKKGFGAPVGAWLKGPLRPMLLDTLSDARLREGGFFDPVAVRAMADAHASGKTDLRKPLYALMVFEHWRQKWLLGAATGLGFLALPGIGWVGSVRPGLNTGVGGIGQPRSQYWRTPA